MKLCLIAFAFLAVAGCTADRSESVSASDAGEVDAHRVDLGTADSALGFALEVVAEPVEWGLFDTEVDATPLTLFEGRASEGESVEVTLPAGVHRLTFNFDAVSYQIVSDRQIVAPTGSLNLSPSSDGAMVFVATRSTLNIHLLGRTNVELVRVGGSSSEPVPIDEARHAREVGPSFDRFLEAYDPTAQDRSAVFDLLREVHERGGAPVQTERGMLFLAPGVPGDSPMLVGSFNNWEPATGWELRQLVPGLYARFVEIPDGRHSYKIAYGESWTKDHANRHIEWDGIDTQSVGFFNSVVRPDSRAGRLVLLPGVESSRLGNSREIYLYLPPDYADGVDHPLLIVHDGNESIVRAQFHQVLDTWCAGRPPESQPVVAFVALPSQDVRLAEYTFATDGSRGDDYVDFLAETLHPMLTESLRVTEDRAQTGLVGASLGGLISYYGLSRHSDTFGYAAGMSSSFFWADGAMLQIIEDRGCFDAEFYLDSGSPDDNFEVTQQMRDLLNTRGCRYRYLLDEGGTHEWWKWKERLPGVLDHFAGETP